MIWTIARKEFVEIVRDGRFLWTGAIIVLLLIVALAVGAQRYAQDRDLRLAASAETRAQWLTQGSKGPHTAAHYGVYAFKPATPLALFDPGYNDFTGTIQYLEAHKENVASFKPAADATAMQRFGDLSGALVLQLLVPLLIILLCFGMISGEREDGTLRQLLSIGVSRSTIIWGKAAGAAMALGAVLLPAVLVGAVLASLLSGQNDPHEMAGFGTKLAALGVGYLVFFGIFVCLSLSVSVLARSSGAALTVLIAFWIVGGLLVPRVAADLSARLYPTPSAFQLQAEVDAGRDKGPHAHEPNHPNYKAFTAEMLRKYKVSRVEDLPYNFVGLALQRDEEIGFRVFDRTYGEVRRQYDRQDRVQEAFAVISPFVAIKALSSALSGTDVRFGNDFEQAAETYRRNMIGIINRFMMVNAAHMDNYSTEWGYRADGRLWSQVPPFDFDPPDAGTVLGRCLGPIVVLLAWLAASVRLLAFTSRRARIDA